MGKTKQTCAVWNFSLCCLSPGQARRDESDLARLLDRPQYSHLLRALEDKEATTPLDVAATFVLSENIRVPIQALDHEQNFYTRSLQVVKKINLAKDFPSKVGGWTNSDLDLIADNLRSLKQSTGLSDSDLSEIL